MGSESGKREKKKKDLMPYRCVYIVYVYIFEKGIIIIIIIMKIISKKEWFGYSESPPPIAPFPPPTNHRKKKIIYLYDMVWKGEKGKKNGDKSEEGKER